MFLLKNTKKLIFLSYLLNTRLFGTINFSGEGASINLSSGSGRVALEGELALGQGSIVDLQSLNNNFKAQTGTFNVLLSNATLKIGKGLVFVSSGVISCSSASPNNSIVLSNSALVSFNQELPLANLNFVIPSGCSATFSGPVNFSGSVSLQDSSSKVIFNVSSTAKFGILPNGGTIRLLNKLTMDIDQSFPSAASIDLNGCELSIRADLSKQLNFTSGGTVSIFGPVQLNAPVYFSSPNQQVVIQGVPSQDIILGPLAKFVVGQGARIAFRDVRLSGAQGSSLFELYDSATAPGTLSFYGSTLSMASTVYQNTGTINFIGPNNQIVGDNISFFNVNGPQAKVVVDGGSLNYFCSDSANPLGYPFILNNSDSVQFINGGTVSLRSSEDSNLVDAVTSNGTTVYFDKEIEVTPSSQIIITNVDLLHPKTVTIDGSGRTWNFKRGSSGIINIAQNVTVTIANVRLSGFSTNAFSLGPSAGVLFGPGVTIEPAPDSSILWPIKALNSIKFCGDNTKLFMTTPGAITAMNASVELSFQKCNLVFSNASGLSTNDTTSTVFKDCSLDLFGKSVSFSAGNYSFVSNCKIFSSLPERFNLSFNSKGILTINSASTLNFGPNVDFIYNPNVSLDVTVPERKRHFVLQDHSSTVIFDRTTFSCPSAGLILDSGRFIAKNWFTLSNAAVDTTGDIEIYQSFNIQSSGAAKITLDGKFRQL